MSDRELLELAAKAAGVELDWDVPSGSSPWRITGDGEDCGPANQWNPLSHDGDALRLAVKLKMRIDVSDDVSSAYLPCKNFMSEAAGDDPYAATRWVIVRAAAELGRSMP